MNILKKIELSLKPKFSRTVNVLILMFFIGFVLFPVFWMFSTSIRPTPQVFSIPPILWPSHPTLEPYIKVIEEEAIGTYFFNSAFVAAATVSLSTLIGGLGAYGFSRFKFKGSGLLLGFILSTQMIPHIVIVLPYFKIMTFLHLTDTYLGLIIA